MDNLQNFEKVTARKKSVKPTPKKVISSQLVDIIVCQDASNIPQNLKAVAELLRGKGYDVHAEGAVNKDALIERLKDRHSKGQPAPTDIFMDVSGGGGDGAARQVISWLEKNYPGSPLPTINFLSLDLGMAIDAACKLRQSDGRFLASAIDSGELSWTQRYLSGAKEKKDNSGFGFGGPYTTTLRDLLNNKLGCTLPLDIEKDDYFSNRLKNMNEIANDGVLSAWRLGKIPADEAIERMRDYATGLAESLRDGFYMQGNGKGVSLESDAAFYGAAGFPRKGPVVFSLQEAEKAYEDAYYNKSKPKPVLVMRGYDPAVIPLMASGKLGGLVVTSSFMASHLKLMCETHMVTGLFGVMPAGQKTLTGEFNEEAKPNDPTYFDGDTVTIAGKIIKRGQQVLVGLGGNGMMFNPPEAVKTTENDAAKIEDADRFKINALKLCFAEYFKEKGLPVHGVKANVDAGNRKQLGAVEGIGLVRTEQMVAANKRLLEDIKAVLLTGDEAAYKNFSYDSSASYWGFVEKLNDGKPVKIRLFDFVHGEILNRDEQKQFLKKYPRLDIHGGKALATWPRLYREQVGAIFKALKSVSSDVPLEIMMPAVRTKKDVQTIKKVIEEEAQKAGILSSQYSFGVMIETLDSCKKIEKIAPLCDFISFGTNDLTQQYTGMGRGDLKAHAKYAGKHHGLDPFKVLAPEVLDIVRDVTARGRKANPALKVDICGAQAADPDTAIKLFDAGIDNISVAPNPANLYSLPLLLNYRMYDALQTAKVVHKPKHASGSGRKNTKI